MKKILIMWTLSLSAFGFQEDYAPPQIIRHYQGTNMMWVSLSLIAWQNGALVTADGGMPLESMLTEYTCNRLRGVRRSQEKRLKKGDEDPCVGSFGHVPLAHNFDGVLRSSHYIFTGIARHTEHGFFYGTPSELVTLEIEQTVRFPLDKMSVPRGVDEYFYLIKWPTSFMLGHVPLCVADSRYIFDDKPLEGKRFLVFTPLISGDELGSLIFTGYNFIFGEAKNGDLIIPPELIGDPDLEGIRTFDEMIARLAQLAALRPVREEPRWEKKK